MNTDQLETFICVAEKGSFSKAAEQLFISPTAVMKQINALEDEIGAALFVRTASGVSLTESGKIFLGDARYISEYSKKAVERARRADEKDEKKPIRIGASIMTLAKFILDLWQYIYKADPSFKAELVPFENNPVNSVEILRHLGEHTDIVAGLYAAHTDTSAVDEYLSENGFIS